MATLNKLVHNKTYGRTTVTLTVAIMMFITWLQSLSFRHKFRLFKDDRGPDL
ncbi:MAG: hypothetical protein HFE73_08130 [Firmicutes bacterium]|nr:hypothetical protein [Bacillota bacterium]